jgi:hypothetical protein
MQAYTHSQAWLSSSMSACTGICCNLRTRAAFYGVCDPGPTAIVVGPRSRRAIERLDYGVCDVVN